MIRVTPEFKSQSRPKIAIVGAGAAGLACGYALSRAGAQVTVFDKGAIGQGALWASGGMLAAGFECAEARAKMPFVQLARRGLDLWSDWSLSLGAERLGYRQRGTLLPDGGNDMWLSGIDQYAAEMGFECRPVAPPAGLQAKSVLEFPDDAELDNRLLPDVFAKAITEAGGTIRPFCAVTGVEDAENDITLSSDDERLGSFDHAVLTTGCSHLSGALDLPVIEPVKGQMLSIESGNIELPACIRAREVYLSQKTDGRIVIGATSEPGLSDSATDDASISELRCRAEALFPALRGQPEIERWAGVRPCGPNRRPLLDQLWLGRLIYLNGLYRNGVLLAPAMAERVVAYLTGLEELPAAYRI